MTDHHDLLAELSRLLADAEALHIRIDRLRGGSHDAGWYNGDTLMHISALGGRPVVDVLRSL